MTDRFDDWLLQKITAWKKLETMSRRDPYYMSALEAASKEMLYAIDQLQVSNERLKALVNEDIKRLQIQNDFESECG